MDLLKWLYPGLGVKRWILLTTLGILMLAAGIAAVFDTGVSVSFQEHVTKPYGQWAQRVGMVGPATVGVVIVILACLFTLMGIRNTIRSILSAILPSTDERFIDLLYRKRFLEKGQQIVVIGGGTGLSTLLRGLKQYTSNLTAIVTVADDGGSSGRLRRDMGVLPPGDIRNCLVALADTEALMEQLFRYRYKEGPMKGHSFGNLFIATMSDVAGNFEEAIRISSKVLAICGRVLPSTTRDVVLKATFDDGTSITGESEIPKAHKRIESVELVPSDAEVLPDSIDAISRADVIVLGPGSLYTSVIPNLLVNGMADAIKSSKAVRVYICNVMTQPGETQGHSVCDHVEAIRKHVGDGLIDYVLINTRRAEESLLERYREEGASPVKDDSEKLVGYGIKTVRKDLASFTEVVRHDPDKLALAVLQLLIEEGIRPNRKPAS